MRFIRVTSRGVEDLEERIASDRVITLRKMYLAHVLPKAVYELPPDASLNDCRRALNCRPLRYLISDEHDPFFCDLGTLWCGCAHGPWEDSRAEELQRLIRDLQRPASRFKRWFRGSDA